MDYLLAALLVLGPLIFVHELAHFLVARAGGIRVERFSLGFPPKMIGKKIGDTEYCISWIPFGGYVKVAGMSDIGKPDVQGESWEFGAKPIPVRMAVVVAGSIMNFVFAFIIIFGLLYTLGEPVYPARIGEVEPGSPMAVAGVEPGDRILAVAGQPVKTWRDITAAFEEAGPGLLTLRTLRGDLTRTVSLRLEKPEESGLGVLPFVPARVGSVQKGRPAEKAGLLKGDRIVAVDGEPVDQWNEFREKIRSRPGHTVRLEGLREGRPFTADVTVEAMSLLDLGAQEIRLTELVEEVLVDVQKDTVGSRIAATGVYGPEVPTAIGDRNTLKGALSTLVRKIREGLPDGDQLTLRTQAVRLDSANALPRIAIAWRSEGGHLPEDKETRSARRIVEEHNGTIVEESGSLTIDLRRTYGQIGITVALDRTPLGFLGALDRGVRYTAWTTATLARIIKGLVSGEISRRTIGGPILMVQLAGESVRSGWEEFFGFMAALSINLGFLNLLPIPALDGGHLLLLIVEAIRRRPLSMKQKEVVQRIGVVFLILVMAYVMFNDLARLGARFLR